MSAQKHPLVLIPGLLCDAQLWRPQREGLPDIDPWIADVTRDDSLAAMAKRVLAEAPWPAFALAGLSMGGYIAMEIMRQAPQRVTRLALLDTQAQADTPEATRLRQVRIELARSGRFGEVIDLQLPLLLHPSQLADAALVAIVKSMARNVGPEAFARQQQAIMGRADSRASLRSIRCPALVLCGEADALTPLERHRELASLVPGATLEVIADCGHLSTLEKPAEVNQALARWLQ